MLKVSVFYLEKHKSFHPKKIYFRPSQQQNKKAFFTDPIFIDGFGCGDTHSASFDKKVHKPAAYWTLAVAKVKRANHDEK